MKLRELPDKRWNQWEKQRFLNDDTKTSTDAFDPESFKHDGFEDREQYVETYVPALADAARLELELNNFTPPRLKSINDSPYQALVIRFGILWTLIQQLDQRMEKSALLEAVKSWQQAIVEEYGEAEYSDDLVHLAKAAIDYQNDIDDSELNMVYSYFRIRNQEFDYKHEHYTWLDFFERLASIDRFPKVSRSEKPSHALDTIEKGLWSLQEQAIVYEIVHPEEGSLVGIPDEYVDFVRDWLSYEMSTENYRRMLAALKPFDKQAKLIAARETFGIETPTKGLNEKRRESIVDAGVFPSDLLEAVVRKDDLKVIVDEYGLNAHKQKTDEMIEQTINYFEQSQAMVDDGEPLVELYLKCYTDIADGDVARVPPQLHGVVDEDSTAEKLDILFEQATAQIFEEIFQLDSTTLLGQTASGTVADGEISQDRRWLLWDNKRRTGTFKLGASTRATIKSYIDTKNQQHDVEWFLIIAPEFAESAADNALKLEMQVGVDIRLIRAEDFMRLATFWRDRFGTPDRELPLSIFTGAGEFNLGVVKDTLETQFA